MASEWPSWQVGAFSSVVLSGGSSVQGSWKQFAAIEHIHFQNKFIKIILIRQKSSFSPVRWVLEVATVFVWFSPNVFASPPPGSGTPEQSLWAGQSIWSLFSLWRWCSWPSAHWVHRTHAAECSSGHTHAEKGKHTIYMWMSNSLLSLKSCASSALNKQSSGSMPSYRKRLTASLGEIWLSPELNSVTSSSATSL